MADRISWIKNLLSLGTPAEREALSQVRTHAIGTGNERLIIGDRFGPADLSQTLQNTGNNKQVMFPAGFKELKQKIAGEGSEMFQAHAHPSGDPTPSLADLETWANDHYVRALNKQGTYLPASKYARDRMWITSPLSNQNMLMMDPMPYKDYHATAGTLQKLRDADATYKMKLFDKNNPDRNEYFQRLQDFTAPWLKPETTSNEELARTYTSLGRAHKANQQAAAAPITMDPAGYLTKYRPDLQVGDVYPEWFKYLEQKGDPIFKAEGGQIPGYDIGGPTPAVTILKSLPDMKGGINWIKNLLSSYGSPAEQSAVAEVTDWGRKTGNEMSVVGRRADDPANLLRSYGDADKVQLPKGWNRLQQDAAQAGQPIFTAHPHPDVPPVPSAGDMEGWANAAYQPTFGMSGTNVPPNQLGRENMWIAGTRGPQDHLLVPAMKHVNRSEDYDLLRRIREVDAKFDERLVNNNQSPQFKGNMDAFWKFLPAHFFPEQFSKEQTGQLFNTMLYGEKANAYSKHTPILMDPANQAVHGMPDIQWGDVVPEWMKFIQKEGVDTYRAEGGQVEDTPFPLAYASQYYAKGGSVPGYQTGSKVLGALREAVRGYKDAPADKLTDWPWRPLSQVAKDMPTEIPQHVLAYGDFMRDQAKKLSTQGLDTRDGLKAYLTTLASMQRQAIGREALPGLKLTSDERLIRPEGAYADWLGSKWGQKYLEHAVQGEAHPDAIKDAVQNMTPYGFQNLLGRQMTAAPSIVPGTEAALADQVNRASRGIRSPRQWAAATEPYEGIDSAKKGFFGSLIGYGDRPTLDARQLNLHAFDPDMAKNVMRRVDGGEQAVERLADRQRALDFQMPWEYDPYYQHLAHHTIWDATSGTVTPHTDLIDMMKNRAEGGQVGDMPLAYMSQYFDEGGQVPGYQQGGFDDDESRRHSIPYGSFGLPQSSTPTFKVPLGKGEATVGGSYDMINRILDAQLGYEYPVGKSGARLGVQGNFNKYIGEGGDQVKPNWGARIGLTLPFAEGGEFDPYEDIAEAQRLMGAYK